MGKMHTSVAYQNLEDFVYGKAVYPVKLKNGMNIGGGTVYPELNYTLPPMTLNKDTVKEAVAIYKEMTEGICVRAKEIHCPGFLIEIETVPSMTENPDWAIETCKTVVDTIKEHEAKSGIKGAVKITPNDNREGAIGEHMYSGLHWDTIWTAFEGCGKAGAEIFAIESCAGKEVHDEGTMFCEIAKCLFSMSILRCRDMNKIWPKIVDIAKKHGAVGGGDTACGFANTSMVLAEKNYIPRVFGAVDRVMCAVGSIVAQECGAVGPDKDCGYEGPYIKAITGTPISMEGKTAACAHLSSVGNVAMCLPDVWSNESVQNIKLLGGMAPTVSFEMLEYDCRLMNEFAKNGKANLLRDMNADSDSILDPQAYMLRPDVVLAVSKELVKVDGYYPRMKKAGELTVETLKKAAKDGKTKLDDKEMMWLDTMGEQLAALPSDEGKFIDQVAPTCERFDPKTYDM